MVTRANESLPGCRLREGMPIGAQATLRGQGWDDCVQRLVGVSLPRGRDCRGVSEKAFDGRRNYKEGVRVQLIFTEIDYDKVNKLRGMDAVIVTTSDTDEEARELLAQLGMPFQK